MLINLRLHIYWWMNDDHIDIWKKYQVLTLNVLWVFFSHMLIISPSRQRSLSSLKWKQSSFFALTEVGLNNDKGHSNSLLLCSLSPTRCYTAAENCETPAKFLKMPSFYANQESINEKLLPSKVLCHLLHTFQTFHSSNFPTFAVVLLAAPVYLDATNWLK